MFSDSLTIKGAGKPIPREINSSAPKPPEKPKPQRSGRRNEASSPASPQAGPASPSAPIVVPKKKKKTFVADKLAYAYCTPSQDNEEPFRQFSFNYRDNEHSKSEETMQKMFSEATAALNRAKFALERAEEAKETKNFKDPESAKSLSNQVDERKAALKRCVERLGVIQKEVVAVNLAIDVASKASDLENIETTEEVAQLRQEVERLNQVARNVEKDTREAKRVHKNNVMALNTELTQKRLHADTLRKQLKELNSIVTGEVDTNAITLDNALSDKNTTNLLKREVDRKVLSTSEHPVLDEVRNYVATPKPNQTEMSPVWGVLEGVRQVRTWRGACFSEEACTNLARDVARYLELHRPAVPWAVSLPLFLWTREWHAPVVYLATRFGSQEPRWEVLNTDADDTTQLEKRLGDTLTLSFSRQGVNDEESVVEGWEGATLHRDREGDRGYVLRYDARAVMARRLDYTGYSDSLLWLPRPSYCFNDSDEKAFKKTWFTTQRPHPSALELVYSKSCEEPLSSHDEQLLCEPLLDPEIDELIHLCRKKVNPNKFSQALADRAADILDADVQRPLALPPKIAFGLNAIDGAVPPRSSSALLTTRDTSGSRGFSKQILQPNGEPTCITTPNICLESHIALSFERCTPLMVTEMLDALRSPDLSIDNEEDDPSQRSLPEHPGCTLFVHTDCPKKMETMVKQMDPLQRTGTTLHGIVLPGVVQGGRDDQQYLDLGKEDSVVKLSGPNAHTFLGEFSRDTIAANVATAVAHCKAIGYVDGVAPIPHTICVAFTIKDKKGAKPPAAVAEETTILLEKELRSVWSDQKGPNVLAVYADDVASNAKFVGKHGTGKMLATFLWCEVQGVAVCSIDSSVQDITNKDFLKQNLPPSMKVRDIRGVFLYCNGPTTECLEWTQSLPRGCVVHGGASTRCRALIFASERKANPVRRNLIKIWLTMMADSKPYAKTDEAVTVPYSLLRTASMTGDAQPFIIELSRLSDPEEKVTVQLSVQAGGVDAVPTPNATPCTSVDAAFTLPPLLLRAVVDASQGKPHATMTPGELIQAFSLQILHWEQKRIFIMSFSGRRHLLAEHVQIPTTTKGGNEISTPTEVPKSKGSGPPCALCDAPLLSYARFRFNAVNSPSIPYMCYYTDCSTKRVDICKLCAYKCHVYEMNRYGRRSRYQYSDIVQDAFTHKTLGTPATAVHDHPTKGSITYTADATVRQMSELIFKNDAGEEYPCKPHLGAVYNTTEMPYRVELGMWMYRQVAPYVQHLLAAVAAVPHLQAFSYSALTNSKEKRQRVSLSVGATPLWGVRYCTAWSAKLHRGKLIYNPGILSVYGWEHVNTVHDCAREAFHAHYDVHRLCVETHKGRPAEVVPIRIFTGSTESRKQLRGTLIGPYSRFSRRGEVFFPPNCIFLSEATLQDVTLKEIEQSDGAATLLARRMLVGAEPGEAKTIFAIINALKQDSFGK